MTSLVDRRAASTLAAARARPVLIGGVRSLAARPLHRSGARCARWPSWPIRSAYSFWLSLHRYDLLNADDVHRVVGNYARIWHDDQVRNSLKVTFRSRIPVLMLNLVLGFGLALLIHHKARAKALLADHLLPARSC